MPHITTAPYGSWKSPITSDRIVAESIRLSILTLTNEAVYWLESRPSERGRNVIVKQRMDGYVADINRPPFNARTRVHEYGGGAVLVHGDSVYFSNYDDQRLYRVQPGMAAEPVTPETDLRYADCQMDSVRDRIICVREDHRESSTQQNHNEAVNTITALYLDSTARQVVLVSGNDFYASPRVNPEGTKMAWLTWCHPNMPWDGTELWVADIQSSGNLANHRLVAGGLNESIFQPEWSPDGILTYISDRSGWWNIYRQTSAEDQSAQCLLKVEAEFGLPQWVFGLSTYTYISPSQLVCIYTQNGRCFLGTVDTGTGQLTQIETEYTNLSGIKAVNDLLLFKGASANLPGSVVLYDLKTGIANTLKSSLSIQPDPAYLSTPESVTFPTEDNLSAYALYYPPRNPDFAAPEGELPPLLVISHGGPTGATISTLDLSIQFWTSRGFAVMDVNYGGSTGYGRAYRERLNDRWGIVDVDDCVNGARFLAANGRVDPNRLAIRGGSAGGYTTLSALAFRDVFHAGASYYGVSDLEALALDTHKFESRYLDHLIGPYPERKDLYIERSPIYNVAGLNCPMIFFQGSEDRVVPPSQAQQMVDALIKKGLPVAFIQFDGEQHGFRQAASIKRALDAELYFYGRIFNFTPADPIEPVHITNLDE